MPFDSPRSRIYAEKTVNSEINSKEDIYERIFASDKA